MSDFVLRYIEAYRATYWGTARNVVKYGLTSLQMGAFEKDKGEMLPSDSVLNSLGATEANRRELIEEFEFAVALLKDD